MADYSVCQLRGGDWRVVQSALTAEAGNPKRLTASTNSWTDDAPSISLS